MPIVCKSYTPQPLIGQALLDNFARVRRYLLYKEGDKSEMRPLQILHIHTCTAMEQYGDNKQGNHIIQGEAVPICSYLRAQGVYVDLVYLDLT